MTDQTTPAAETAVLTPADPGKPTTVINANVGGTTGAVATGAGSQAGQAPPPPKPSLGRIVIVRAPHRKDAPGIVTDVRSDTLIDVQVFRGDHLPHTYSVLEQMDPANKAGQGWFWPPRT